MKQFSFFQPFSSTIKFIALSIFSMPFFIHAFAITKTASVSGNWSDQATWGNTIIPKVDDDVVIGGNNIVSVDISSAVCKSLTIETSGTLKMNSGAILAVSGNWTNNGTFTAGTGTVTFNGTTGTQSLSGTTAFYNFTLNNANSTTNFGNTTIYIAGTLNKSAGIMEPSTGTIIFTGATGSITGTGAKTFYNLIINDGAYITHGAGYKNLTIKNNFANNGTFVQDQSLTTYFAGTNSTHNLTGNGTTTFGSFDINGGNTVNAGAHSFTISGLKVDVTGIFNGETATVTISGQTIITASGNLNFNNLTLFAGSGLKTISTGTVVVVNGNLITNDLLQINSASDLSNGSLIVKGNSTGNVTYNRYLSPARWYITSAPVNVSAGFAANSSKINKEGSEYDLAWYKESNNDGWQYYTSFPDVLGAGSGYLISLNNSANYGDGKIQFTGSLNSNVNASVTTSTNNGWNAVGNPYTSAIRIAGTGGFIEANTTVPANDILSSSFAAVYVWNQINETTTYNETQQYYKAISNSNYTPPGGTDYGTFTGQNTVQVGQGFIVNTKVSGSVVFTKTMQVSDVSTSLKSAETSWPGITLMVESNGQTRSTVIAFNDTMTTGLDVTYDAGLLAADDFQVYTHLVNGNNPVDFAIQCLPDYQYSQIKVPVGVDLPDGGELVFKASGIILSDGIYPIIEDKVLDIRIALKAETDSYKVNLNKNTSGIGRFYLSFGGDMALSVSKTPLDKPNYTASLIEGIISISGPVESGAKAQLFDIRGQKVGEFQLESSNRNEIATSGLFQNVYLLKIEGKNWSQVLKLIGVKF